MADLDAGRDPQDLAEVFDEDNTDVSEGLHEAPDFLDLPDVYDATAAEGDDEDEAAEIGDDLDDAEIVERGRETVDEDEDAPTTEGDFVDLDDFDDFDDPDAAAAPDDVELEFAGDLNDRAGALSSAQRLESRALSDQDLRELDYQEGVAREEETDDGPA